MGVTGERFLQLNHADGLELTSHALERLAEHARCWVPAEKALMLFRAARQVRPKAMLLLGYRPAYGRRRRRGQKSWYFRFTASGRELIAVIGQSDSGALVWMTTYGRTRQSDQLRIAEYGHLAGVA